MSDLFGTTDTFPMDIFYPPKFKRKWMRVMALVLYPIWLAGAGIVLLIGGTALVLMLLTMVVIMSVKSIIAYVKGTEQPE